MFPSSRAHTGFFSPIQEGGLAPHPSGMSTPPLSPFDEMSTVPDSDSESFASVEEGELPYAPTPMPHLGYAATPTIRDLGSESPGDLRGFTPPPYGAMTPITLPPGFVVRTPGLPELDANVTEATGSQDNFSTNSPFFSQLAESPLSEDDHSSNVNLSR